MRREPLELQGMSRPAKFVDHVGKVLPDKVRQQEAIVQGRAPAHQFGRIGGLPKSRNHGAQQQLLHQAHPRMRRHLEAAHLDQPQPSRAESGEYSLSMQNSARCVLPVRSTSKWRNNRSTSQGAQNLLGHDLLAGDFQFVQAVVPGFVHARGLARRPDELPGEQIRQRRMIVPIRHQAAEQVGPAQDRTIGRGSLRRTRCGCRRRCPYAGRRA